MTAKEYLSQAYRIDQRINSKIEQVRSLHELASKATLTLSDGPRCASPNYQTMETTIAKMVDLEREINDEIDTLVDLKRAMVSIISQVDNTEQKMLLELRYLCYKQWGHIAQEMDYGIDNVYKLHGNALKSVSQQISLQ